MQISERSATSPFFPSAERPSLGKLLFRYPDEKFQNYPHLTSSPGCFPATWEPQTLFVLHQCAKQRSTQQTAGYHPARTERNNTAAQGSTAPQHMARSSRAPRDTTAHNRAAPGTLTPQRAARKQHWTTRPATMEPETTGSTTGHQQPQQEQQSTAQGSNVGAPAQHITAPHERRRKKEHHEPHTTHRRQHSKPTRHHAPEQGREQTTSSKAKQTAGHLSTAPGGNRAPRDTAQGSRAPRQTTAHSRAADHAARQGHPRLNRTAGDNQA